MTGRMNRINWKTVRDDLIVFVVLSGLWSVLIIAGTRLWHK
jgi:hypothetical protein